MWDFFWSLLGNIFQSELIPQKLRLLVESIVAFCIFIFVIYKFWKKAGEKKSTPLSKQAKILFIDDQHEDFRIIETLRKEGWQVDALKDLDSFSNPYLENAYYVFVDRHGVGNTLQCSDGLQLAAEVKRKFDSRKFVILYSSDSNGPIFDQKLDILDAKLNKNAAYPEFESLLNEKASSKRAS